MLRKCGVAGHCPVESLPGKGRGSRADATHGANSNATGQEGPVAGCPGPGCLGGTWGADPAHSPPHSPASEAHPVPSGAPAVPGAAGVQAGTAWAAPPASSAGASAGSVSLCCPGRARVARTRRPRTAGPGRGPPPGHALSRCGAPSPWTPAARWTRGLPARPRWRPPSFRSATGRSWPCPRSSSCASTATRRIRLTSMMTWRT